MSESSERAEEGGDPAGELEDGEQDEQPHRDKRAKLQQFKRGTVKLIRVHDFMTYSGTVTIRPGPRLNLVLGPNGTGKSSLVCALCVGLAGSTKLLGRADNLSEYVRRNCHKAWTEITLSGGKARDVVIRRDITVKEANESGRAGFHSQFKMNGRDITMDEVKNAVSKLNIQFDNLCQFLPQDKVVEFARMNAQELLVATEKALGDSKLYELHMKLAALRQEVKVEDADRVRTGNTLERLLADHARQQRDYERFAQREKLKEEAEALGHKIEWLKVKTAKDEWDECKAALAEAKANLVQQQGSSYEDDGPVKDLDDQVKDAKRTRDIARATLNSARKASDQIQLSLEQAKLHLDDLLDQIKGLDASAVKRQAAIDKGRRDVADLTAAVARCPQTLPDEVLQRDRELRDAAITARTRGRELDEKYQDITHKQAGVQDQLRNAQGQFSRLNNRRVQRLAQLEQRSGRDTRLRDLHDWVNQHRDSFSGPVFGPLALELDMVPGGNPMWANFVEQQCKGMFNNFVVSCKRDEQVLTDAIKSNGFGNINVSAFTADFSGPIQHRLGHPSRYRQYGLVQTLDQVFDAPPLIKHLLCDVARVNEVYIGDHNTTALAADLFEKTDVRTVYAEGYRLSFVVSRYNKASNISNEDPVYQAQTLAGPAGAGVDEERAQLEQHIANLNLEHDRLQKELVEVQKDAHDNNASYTASAKGVKEIEERRKSLQAKLVRMNMDLNMAQKQLQRALAEPDPKDREPALKAQQVGVLGVLGRQAGELAKSMPKIWAAARGMMAAELALAEREAQFAAAKTWVDGRKAALRAALKVVATQEAINRQKRTVFEASKASAEHLAPKTPERVAQWRSMSDDADELAKQQADKTEQADAIVCSDESVRVSYLARAKQIADLEKQVALMDNGLTIKGTELVRLRDLWLPDLKKMLEVVNKAFTTNFMEIGCAGEIALHEDEDYDKFAIHIRVKFRDIEQLQLLTANRQSGGERSVATILYLIALQSVTETPFRVVDEINQGMDPVNERKVFIQLVESSCKPDTPQCFLLTPKLLPGLPFTEDISVLLIQNGPAIEEGLIKNFDMEAGLYGQRWAKMQ